MAWNGFLRLRTGDIPEFRKSGSPAFVRKSMADRLYRGVQTAAAFVNMYIIGQ